MWADDKVFCAASTKGGHQLHVAGTLTGITVHLTGEQSFELMYESDFRVGGK